MSTLEHFAFQLPLYAPLDLPEDLKLKSVICEYVAQKIDGHCPYCKDRSTFSTQANTNFNIERNATARERVEQATGFKSFELSCARDWNHKLRFWFLISEDKVTKVGQYPSLADIANDEASNYRNILRKEDAHELHKAIGLAAHGVGVGSFVYLRRVFENLIYGRFLEFREAEGWSEEDFFALRMDDKVKFLKEHIPSFLYENRKLYSILSEGIHELSEEVCLNAFEPLKLSIKIILEEDKKKKEDLELKKKAADAIASFNF